MKLSAGLNLLSARNIEKKISKKITLANTSDRVIDKKAQKKAHGVSNDPIYFQNGNNQNPFNPDIRFRTDFAYSPLTGINYRNDLLMFAENDEIKKCVQINADETVIIDTEVNKYPVYPQLSQTTIHKDKQKTADAIQDYLDNVFYPKLYNWYNFKDEGLIDIVKEFLITGKLAYEIIYDSLTNPKDIIGVQPLDPSTLQKVKVNDVVYFIQRTNGTTAGMGTSNERILQENQVVLVEWNKFDYGFVSYVDELRRSFNIMRSMQTSKILWFAAKSQVRMHIKLALGDVSRPEAIQKLTESKNQYINQFSFDDDGVVKFNNSPNNNGYREFFTAETAQSGSPEIEEINANGPDLSETDSLSFWAKQFYAQSRIPYDRIDPNASETWGFTDVANLRKIEVNYGKFINSIRKMLNPLFMKPIIIQLTLKEVEIGIDLNLIDSIKMQWTSFNQYDKLAELETLNKKIELAQNLSAFGEYQDAAGNMRKAIPLLWITKTFLDLTKEQLDSMEAERVKENLMLGFNADGSMPEGMGEEDDMGMEDDMNMSMEDDEPVEDESEKDDEPVEDESTSPIVEMVKSGDISEEDLKELIDSGELTNDEIEALKAAGLYPEESEEEIQKTEDSSY